MSQLLSWKTTAPGLSLPQCFRLLPQSSLSTPSFHLSTTSAVLVELWVAAVVNSLFDLEPFIKELLGKKKKNACDSFRVCFNLPDGALDWKLGKSAASFQHFPGFLSELGDFASPDGSPSVN